MAKKKDALPEDGDRQSVAAEAEPTTKSTRKKGPISGGKRNAEVFADSDSRIVRVVMHRTVRDGRCLYHSGQTFNLQKQLAEKFLAEKVAYREGDAPLTEEGERRPEVTKDYQLSNKRAVRVLSEKDYGKVPGPEPLDFVEKKVYSGDECNQPGYSVGAQKGKSHKVY